MRIVFFGTPEFAVPSLRALLAGPDFVAGVVSQPDKPAGRGQRLTQTPVKQVAEAARVPLVQPEKVRSIEFLDVLRAWEPDLIVVVAYGKILPREILALPPQGCINVHASLLPKYRGAAPVQWAILCGEEISGVTIMQMNERMDAGDILLQRETAIGAEETHGELQVRLAELGAAALVDVLQQLRAGTITRRPQREEEVTLAPMIKKEHGRIDWTEPATMLARQVRAFNPWPSAYTLLAGTLLKIHRAHAAGTAASSLPGSLVAVGDGIHVATGEGILVLDELQLAGRKRLGAREFARGSALHVGTVLG